VAAEISAQTTLVLAVSIALDSVSDALAFQTAIDTELQAAGVRCVLVDARNAQLSTQPMNESMWRWVKQSAHFDRLAIVNQSQNLSVAAAMKARAIGTKKVQVFNEFQAAARWLVGRPRDDKGTSNSMQLGAVDSDRSNK
jgi:hypothetical protein